MAYWESYAKTRWELIAILLIITMTNSNARQVEHPKHILIHLTVIQIIETIVAKYIAQVEVTMKK